MTIGTSGRRAFALRRSSRPVIPGMLMSERTRISERSPASAMHCSAIGRLRKLHREAVSAEIAPELLAKQHLDIGLVVDHQNKHIHTLTSLSAEVAPRGSTIRNSVNAPGLVLTSIDPPCCLTMMS